MTYYTRRTLLDPSRVKELFYVHKAIIHPSELPGAVMFNSLNSVALILPIIIALLTMPGPAIASYFPPNTISGVWEVADATGKIEIFPCGSKFCGRIVWIKEPTYPADDPGGMGGKPLLDRENPKKELRSRPQLGLIIMEGYTYNTDNLWDQGLIYNTENGKTYQSRIKMHSTDRLELRGFIGIPLLGGSTVWKRMR